MSSRADVIPKPIVDSLQKLQDAVPFRPFQEVKRTIEADLGHPLSVLFKAVDETALASASIAQV
jgi:ubiquinone biosynthesis protein